MSSMTKVHTRTLRKLKFRIPLKAKKRTRAKTFKTEEAAKKYAEEKGITKYHLEDICTKENQHKFRIVED